MNYAQLDNIKLDLLGLKAVGIINEVCSNLNLKPEDFDINYENVFSHLQDVKYPYGLFQISGDCNLGVVNKVKPKNMDDLAAVTALARPGALQFVDRYAQFVNEGKNESIHPFFDELLKSTASLALYQESTMQMCEKIGLTKADGEVIRKCIGKKKIKEMAKWKDIIFETCEKNGLNKQIPDLLWEILEQSANYSFNKCLSLDSLVDLKNGKKEKIKNIKKGDFIVAFDIDKKKDHLVEVLNIYHNKVEMYEVELEDGKKIKCSLDHKFLTENFSMKSLREIIKEDIKIISK
jgi:DNA polymerase-3 subunit alpha